MGTHVDADAVSVAALVQPTDGCTCEGAGVVVRHADGDCDVLSVLFHAEFSALVGPAGEEIELVGGDGECKGCFDAVGEAGCPVRKGVVGGPVAMANRFEDGAVFLARKPDGITLGRG